MELGNCRRRACISVSKEFLTLKSPSNGQATLVRELAPCPRQEKNENLSGMQRKKCFGDGTRKRGQGALVSSPELKHIELNKYDLTPSSSSLLLSLFFTTCYTQQGRCRTPLPPIFALGTKLQVCLCPRAWPHPLWTLGLVREEGPTPKAGAHQFSNISDAGFMMVENILFTIKNKYF